ncbi:hypothetical protein Sjap_014997 [Stephania japonica]|uniref:Uncharacterized protein n=1 Tax=Stephania japonica TaxID=461633 RepID=A0AAP0NSF9_9MAGN
MFLNNMSFHSLNLFSLLLLSLHGMIYGSNVDPDELVSLQFSQKRLVPTGPNPQVLPTSTKFLPKVARSDGLASLQFSQKRLVPTGPNPQVPPTSTKFLPKVVRSDGLASLQFRQKRLVPMGPNPEVPPSSTKAFGI